MSQNYSKVDAIAASGATTPPSTTTTTNSNHAAATSWTNQPAAPIKHVIIVGAGPSGLVLGILLARSAIRVTILEASDQLDANPRAAHYAPSACYELHRAGVLDDVKAQGFFPDSVCWRRRDGSLLGGIRGADADVDFPMLCLPLDRLDRLLLAHFERYDTTEIRFEHRVVDIRQTDRAAAVEVQRPDGSREWCSADYVVGADGANSQIRRSLYGDMNYPGETLQKQIIATNVRYDFARFGYWDSNFIVHEHDWFMAAKITVDGLWRVTYGDKWGLSNDEYTKRLPARFEKILPGNPKPSDYELVSASPYKLHQRCAPAMREGRFLLVADAGHLCNPFGGMGLTGGFADVGSLHDALLAIHTGRVPDTRILDEYSRVRIQKWRDIVDPVSRKNFGLIWDPAREAERQAFFALTRQVAADKQLANQVAHSTHGLRENFEVYIAQAGRDAVPRTGVDSLGQHAAVGAHNVVRKEGVV